MPLAQARLSHVFLLVFDLDVMVRFYRDTLGFDVAFEAPGECAFFQLGGARVALYPGRTRAEPADMWLVVDCEDLDATVAKLAANGAQCEPIRPVPFGRAADLHDPEGNRLELHEPEA